MASRLSRQERLIILSQELVKRSGELISLDELAEKYKIARSTISEDLSLIREAVEAWGTGEVQSSSGVGGGIRFVPIISSNEARVFLKRIKERLEEKGRVLPGGFLYTTDLFNHPSITSKFGEIFATVFNSLSPDVIVTMETKGIPTAIMTARYMGLPLVIIRRENRPTEGPTVSINYISGSTQKVQLMTLGRKALEGRERAIFIDDFLRGGGTVRGAIALLKEFNAQVVGVGILILGSPKVREAFSIPVTSLFILEGVNELSGEAKLSISESISDFFGWEKEE
ncbi:MAG: pur operon repressor [bacterium]|nr:pur operon repressor [bacterium]